MGKNNGEEKRARELYAKEIQEEKANKGWEYNRNLLETIIDSLVTVGPDGLITDVNSATEKATGIPREKIIGTDFSEYFTEPDKARVGYKQVFDIGKVVDYELYLKHINGSSIPVLYNASVYKDKEGQIIGVLAVARDISEKKRYEDELADFALNVQQRIAELVIANKKLVFRNEEISLKNEEISYISHHDFLTGLYNRAFFEEAKLRLDTPRQLPFSIIMGDINGLKLINDGFGHSKGDELLVEIAKILKSCCRKEDIVSRIGGDEFGILLPKTDSQSAQRICDSIYDTCKGYALDGSSNYPSISLGHATKNFETETMDNILTVAEEYMSRHKLLESKSAHSSIIASIKTIMFEESQETEEHAERMVQLSKSIGLAMSLTDDKLNDLELLSTMHDIGKMSIPAAILSKPGKLNVEEWREIKKHPEVGFRIAQATSELIPIADYILCHHERWDGKGYPRGLIGEKIPLLSRIVAIADAFDAMTNDRVYRSAMTKGEAIEEIRRGSGTQFDPEVTRVFIEKVLGQEKDTLTASFV